MSFTVAVVGLAGLAWLAWVLLGLAGYRHHGAPALHDTVSVLQLVFASAAGASTPMLMAKSGHTSVASLARYARPSAEALARWQEQNDPARRQ